MRYLIAIVDTKANDIIGPIQLFRRTEPAVRMFTDLCKTKDNPIGLHVADHELQIFGTMDDDSLEMTYDRSVIITGTQWLTLTEENTQ